MGPNCPHKAVTYAELPFFQLKTGEERKVFTSIELLFFPLKSGEDQKRKVVTSVKLLFAPLKSGEDKKKGFHVRRATASPTEVGKKKMVFMSAHPLSQQFSQRHGLAVPRAGDRSYVTGSICGWSRSHLTYLPGGC